MRQTLTRDARDPAGGDDLGDLPTWDLTDLYPAPDAPEITRDLDWLDAECRTFAAEYEGRLGSLDAAGLLEAIRRNERIDQVAGRLGSYAGLRYYQLTTDPARSKAFGDIQTRLTDASAPLVFFTLELNRIEDTHLDALLAGNAELARYRPVLDRIRKMKPHQLSDELERFLHDQSVVGPAAWNRLFDETMAGLRFEIDGEDLAIEATLDRLSDPDRAKRQAAAEALAAVFAEKLPFFARVTNTLAKEKEIEDRWRKFPTPQSSRHLANDVEPEVVQALRDAVVAAYPRLSHRYYALKARWLGLERLAVWDRNAPLPKDGDRKVGWPEARETVLAAYAGFDPRMAELAEPFFEKGWIDAPATPGKSPGAFAHPTVTDVHPYVLLNYLGKTRDVMTLAHELGHGVHQRLAAKQGEFLSSTPLTLAETASVFGEMLTFRRLLSQAPDARARKILLASKVEDMINTVVRQIAFYDFECRVHDARRNGELTPDDINEIWLTVQKESLGPAFDFMAGYETFWTYIPHFIHSPFYVYAYAFGDLLVAALMEARRADPAGFTPLYRDLLAAGGTRTYVDALKPFGLNPRDPAFWSVGCNRLERLIDQFEDLS